jgi:plasmid stabilization system protein ParE
MAEARRVALWSPEALDDREKIWDYYVRVAGRHTAEKVLREIAAVVTLIEEHPFAGRARNEVRSGLRSFAATSHVVFYRVVNEWPEIVRVLDGRQDIEQKFAARDGD